MSRHKGTKNNEKFDKLKEYCEKQEVNECTINNTQHDIKEPERDSNISSAD